MKDLNPFHVLHWCALFECSKYMRDHALDFFKAKRCGDNDQAAWHLSRAIYWRDQRDSWARKIINIRPASVAL